jgi:hypothetical protein
VIERVGAAAPQAIPASVLLMELRERGYPGGYTMLKLFVASLRPKQAVEPVIRFETGPGERSGEAPTASTACVQVLTLPRTGCYRAGLFLCRDSAAGGGGTKGYC